MFVQWVTEASILDRKRNFQYITIIYFSMKNTGKLYRTIEHTYSQADRRFSSMCLYDFQWIFFHLFNCVRQLIKTQFEFNNSKDANTTMTHCMYLSMTILVPLKTKQKLQAKTFDERAGSGLLNAFVRYGDILRIQWQSECEREDGGSICAYRLKMRFSAPRKITS